MLDHRCTSFSNDNRWLSFSDPTLGLGRCQLSDTRECRVLTASLPADSVVDVEFSPDGTLLTAASRRSGVDLWSVPSGSEVARVSVGVEVRSIEFTPDGKQLLTSGNPSVDRWPIDAMTQDNAKDRFAQREILAESNFPCETALSADGQRLVASLAGDVINVYDLRGPFAPVRMKSVPSFSWFVAISPNGRWVAASEKRNGDIPVWDAATGELLVHLRTTDTLGALVAFSPDNRWLIVSELGRFVFYETANWREGRRWTPPGNPCFGRIEFDSEMKICATLGQRSVTLCDAATFREIATLATSRQEQLATGYPEGTGGLNFSPDGSLLAVGTMHGTVQLWNLRLVRQRLGDLNLGWPEPQADAR